MPVKSGRIAEHSEPAGPTVGTLEERLEALERAGYRATPQRKAILAAMLGTDKTHISAEEICRRARGLCPSVNLATTYRTLDLLGRLGMVRRITFGRRSVLCSSLRPHHHGICLRCGAVVDLPRECSADALLDQDMAAATGGSFAVAGHRIEFYGYCAACRALAPVPAPVP